MWKGKQKRIRSRVLLCTNTLESWTEVLTASTWWVQRQTDRLVFSYICFKKKKKKVRIHDTFLKWQIYSHFSSYIEESLDERMFWLFLFSTVKCPSKPVGLKLVFVLLLRFCNIAIPVWISWGGTLTLITYTFVCTSPFGLLCLFYRRLQPWLIYI